MVKKNCKKLIIVESSDLGVSYSAEAAFALGFEPIFLASLAHYQGDPLEQFKQYTVVDRSRFANPDSCADLAADLGEVFGRGEASEIAGVVSFSDLHLTFAAHLAEALGVPGLDPKVALLKNKSYVAQLTLEYSPATFTFSPEALLTEPGKLIETLRKFWDQFQIKCLLFKPAAGAGAAGVFFVESKDELDWIPEVLEQHIESIAHLEIDGLEESWIAQSFVPGELISLEGCVTLGQVYPFGFTDRRKLGATESGASFPSDLHLSAEVRALAIQAVETLVERSGYKSGYFHCEFIQSGDSLVLIDANMGRLGGGPMGELLALAHGVDPVDVYKDVIEVSVFGKATALKRQKQLKSARSILYGLKEGGKIVQVHLPSEASVGTYRHTQILSSGAQANPMGIDDWSWVGIVTGLKDNTNRCLKSLRIETSLGLESPCF